MMKLQNHKPVNRKYGEASESSPLLPIAWLSLLLILFPFIAKAEQAQDDMITRLRREISEIEAKVSQTETNRQNVTEQVENLDKEIVLRRRLIAELTSKSRKHQSRAGQIESSIRELEVTLDGLSQSLRIEEVKLDSLRRSSGNRMSYMYRRLAASKMTFLIGSQDLNDLAQRRRYLKAVEGEDRRLLTRLRTQVDKVRSDRQAVEDTRNLLFNEKQQQVQELNQVQNVLSARQTEESRLLSEKGRKQSIVKKFAQDTDLLRTLLEERRLSLAQIEGEINRLEVRRPRTREAFVSPVPFKQRAGKLQWPLDRRQILQPYGQIKHPRLGTVTNNTGIDLRANPGDPVYTVAKGQVNSIHWLRGFGNTAIISHGDGYYTVYARLGVFYIAEGDIVEEGAPIGVVGDSGVEEGFHFEVYAGGVNANPMSWLRK